MTSLYPGIMESRPTYCGDGAQGDSASLGPERPAGRGSTALADAARGLPGRRPWGDDSPLFSRQALLAMRSRPGPGGTLVVELDGLGVTWMLRPTASYCD